MAERVIRNFLDPEGNLFDTTGRTYGRNIDGAWVEDLSSILDFENLKFGALGAIIGAGAIQVFGGVQFFGTSIPKDRTTTLLGALLGGVIGYFGRGVIADLTSMTPLEYVLALPLMVAGWIWGVFEYIVDYIVDKLKFW